MKCSSLQVLNPLLLSDMKVQFFKWYNSHAIMLYLIITYLSIHIKIIYHVVTDNEFPAEISGEGCFT